MSLRCIIVEDEPLAVERLSGYVRQLPLLELSATFGAAPAALAYLMTNAVDLVFLDVTLGGMSGLELLETSSVDAEVILTTAHPEHALRAYDLRVADYLLKPFSFARFVQAVDQVVSRLAGAAKRDYVFIKTELRLERVRLDDILYISGDSDYRCIHTTRKELLTLTTFGELEQRLPRDIICRVHRSYMVAIGKIDSIERDQIQIGNVEIPISATYREQLYALIGYAGK